MILEVHVCGLDVNAEIQLPAVNWKEWDLLGGSVCVCGGGGGGGGRSLSPEQEGVGLGEELD